MNKIWSLEEISKKVSEVVADILDVKAEEVTPQAFFKENLDIDTKLPLFSFLLFEIENVFSIAFEFNEMEKLFTVQDLITLVNEKIN